jgi:drug/metabolite transporter (DMT)-like permease
MTPSLPANFLTTVSQRRTAIGYAAAIIAVLITSAYPALTRLSVTTSLTPDDLLLFRFGIGALLFAPMLILRFRRITRAEWRSALPLSFLQGWGMAAFVVFGLQFGPASHAAALGPGAIGAWVAIVAFVCYGVRLSSRKLVGIIIIVSGIGFIVVASYHGLSLETAMIGDAMFLTASALGATYLVNVEYRRLDPVLSAGLVCMTSAMIILPWHYFFGNSTIASAPAGEIIWQIVFQGVLFGGVAFLALNYAIRMIGSQNVGILTAMVPVIGGVCSLVIAGDTVSNVEWVGISIISIGVAVAAAFSSRAFGLNSKRNILAQTHAPNHLPTPSL